jgi:hypothetical protein
LSYECSQFGLTSTTTSTCNKQAVDAKEVERNQIASHVNGPCNTAAGYVQLPKSQTCIRMVGSAGIVVDVPWRGPLPCSATELINSAGNGCHACAAGFTLNRTTRKCVSNTLLNQYNSLTQPASGTNFTEPFRNIPKHEFMQRPRVSYMSNKEQFRNPPKFTRPMSNFNKNTMSSMDSSGTFCARVNF